jgi:uncharacterized repeat protein (TIGR01451 family)
MTGETVDSSPAVVGDRVYIGSYDNEVYSLNADSGHLIWSYITGGIVYSSPAVVGSKVYVGSLDDKVYCLNAENGSKIWSYTTGGDVFSSPIVVGDRVYVGSSDDKVYCLNAENGSKIWSYTTGSQVRSSPAVVGDRVYVGSDDSSVYCLNAENGSKIWNYLTGISVNVSSPAVVGGKVYIGSRDDKIYCLNADNGSLIWSYTTSIDVLSSPAVVGDKVYVGSSDDKVYCLNAENGSKIWSYTTGSQVRSSPAVVGDRVYVGSGDHKVYCLNSDNGSLIWSYITGGVVYSSPAVVGDRVYIGSDDGRVYCFGRGIEVRISPYYQSGVPSSWLDYTIIISNTGNENDNFSLAVSDDITLNWNSTLDNNRFDNVPSGENRQTTLRVYIPDNAIGGTSDNIHVIATGTGVSDSDSCIAQVTIVRGVEVSISPSSQSGFNGATLTYTVTVSNMGNVADTYSLTATDNSGWSPTVPSPLTVQPFTSGEVTLSVTIPSGAIGDTTDNIVVTATGTGVWNSTDCLAHLAIVRGVDVLISPEYQENMPGQTLKYAVSITNTGNVEDTYEVTINDNAGWNLEFGLAQITLPRGSILVWSLKVTITENAKQGTEDNMIITAISENNPIVNDNASCIARAKLVCEGMAVVRPATGLAPFLWGIRKIKVTAGLIFYQGDNLRLIFLKYDNTIESDNVVWSRTAPGAENVNLTNLVVLHDADLPYPSGDVKGVKLVLTDNLGNVIWDNVAWYTVVQDDWSNRITWIILNWGSHNPSQQDQLSNEISQIILNWASVPTVRDQHDFSA